MAAKNIYILKLKHRIVLIVPIICISCFLSGCTAARIGWETQAYQGMGWVKVDPADESSKTGYKRLKMVTSECKGVGKHVEEEGLPDYLRVMELWRLLLAYPDKDIIYEFDIHPPGKAIATYSCWKSLDQGKIQYPQSKLSDDGEKALRRVSLRGFYLNVLMLLDKGVDVNAKDENGNTALHFAAANGYTKVVNLLLLRGAQINAQDNSGYTALINAATYGRTKTIQALLDKGADINLQNEIGATALIMAACRFGKQDWSESAHSKAVKILIDNGADLTMSQLQQLEVEDKEIKRLLEKAKKDQLQK